MFNSILQQVKEYFGRGFLVAAFLPVTVFSLAALALGLELTTGLGPALDRWIALPAFTQGLLLLAGASVAVLLSYAAFGFQSGLAALFQGQWTGVPILGLFRTWGIAYHQHAQQRLLERFEKAQSDAEALELEGEMRAYYPPPRHRDATLPTRLGNILRAAALHVYDRYGIGANVLLPRLRPLLDPEVDQLLENKRITLHLMLLTSLLAATLGLFGSLLAALAGRDWLVLACLLGWPVAALCHANARHTGLAYAGLIEMVFDLYRDRLLAALGYEPPADPAAARQLWGHVNDFLFRNYPIPSDMPQATAGAPPPSQDPPPATRHRGRFLWIGAGWLWRSIFVAALVWNVTSLVRSATPQTAAIPVPARDLPAYVPLTAGDLTTRTLPADTLMPETITRTHQLVGAVPRTALAANTPITTAQVISVTRPDLLSATTAVAVPADTHTTLGGRLLPGAIVQVSSTTSATLRLPAALVLDVTGGDAPAVIVAVPQADWPWVAAHARSGTLIVAGVQP